MRNTGHVNILILILIVASKIVRKFPILKNSLLYTKWDLAQSLT